MCGFSWFRLLQKWWWKMVEILDPDARTLGGEIHARRYYRLLVTVTNGSDNTYTSFRPVKRVAWSSGSNLDRNWALTARPEISADGKTITVHVSGHPAGPLWGYLHIWTVS